MRRWRRQLVIALTQRHDLQPYQIRCDATRWPRKHKNKKVTQLNLTRELMQFKDGKISRWAKTVERMPLRAESLFHVCVQGHIS